MNNIYPNVVYTVPETSKILKITPRMVSRLAKEGKLRSIRIGLTFRVLGQSIIDSFGKEETEIYTLVETAKLLRTTPQTVIKAIKIGTLKSVKIGRAYRIPRQSISNYLGVKSKEYTHAVNSNPETMKLDKILLASIINGSRIRL